MSERVCEELELPNALMTIRDACGTASILYARDPSMPHGVAATSMLELVKLALQRVHGESCTLLASEAVCSSYREDTFGLLALHLSNAFADVQGWM